LGIGISNTIFHRSAIYPSPALPPSSQSRDNFAKRSGTRLFPKAGCVLEAESDFLRDPADTREQSSGDAKIPTDKFALRFVKP
jgi:predicted methyltransferase